MPAPTTLAIALLLAVVVGVSLGMLGGGGSILTVPLLVYVLGLPAHEAVATSLIVVGTTSLAAMIPHARAGRVRFKAGLLFAAGSMVGAYGGGRAAKLVPSTILLVLFGAMMLTIAGFMMRGRKEAEGRKQAIRVLPLLLEGAAIGALTGLVGAGGGFVVVPALVLFAGLSMREAVGTSLLVIALNSAAGFAGHAASTPIQWPLAAMVAAAAVVGSLLGARLGDKVPQAMLRRGFAWFVVVMAVFILAQEIPRALGVEFSLSRNWPIVLGLVSVTFVMAVTSLVHHARAHVTQHG